MNVAQSLKSLSAYPVPSATLQDIAEGAGLSIDTELTQELRKSSEFRRAKAGVYIFLSEAPNVQQNGISYSFSDGERNRLRSRGLAILEELGDTSDTGVSFGYQGEDL
ncbi:MAG: hypothetical protein K2G35_08625 [Duncaniella sp.]|nr:hypothetical protein [Duncaniella sp.]